MSWETQMKEKQTLTITEKLRMLNEELRKYESDVKVFEEMVDRLYNLAVDISNIYDEKPGFKIELLSDGVAVSTPMSNVRIYYKTYSEVEGKTLGEIIREVFSDKGRIVTFLLKLFADELNEYMHQLIAKLPNMYDLNEMKKRVEELERQL